MVGSVTVVLTLTKMRRIVPGIGDGRASAPAGAWLIFGWRLGLLLLPEFASWCGAGAETTGAGAT